MGLFKLYSKEKANFFGLIKLLFIKFRCLINANVILKLIFKDKCGKQHCLPFIGSNMGIEIFLKKRENQKRMHWNRWLRHLCILCIGISRKLYAKACLLFNCFLVIKGILKALFSFIHWLLNFSDLHNYGSNSRKRYTLRLLSKCLVRSTLLPIGDKVPPTLRYPLGFL